MNALDTLPSLLPLAQHVAEPSITSRLLQQETIALLGAFLLPAIIVGLFVWGKTRRREVELHTIAELARLGHSPEQIERLLTRSGE